MLRSYNLFEGNLAGKRNQPGHFVS